jgi:hypothetical protein
MPIPGIALVAQTGPVAAAVADTVARSSAAIVPLDRVLLPLTAALGLAIVVERVVEFLKNVADVAPDRATQFVSDAEAKRADTELARFEALQLAAARDEQQDSEVPEQHPPETILVQEATDPDDGSVLRAFIIQAVAIVVGIVAARLTKLQLFHEFGIDFTPFGAAATSVDYLLTGLFIGGGSGPAHVVIRFLTQRKFSAERDTPARAEQQIALPAAGGAEDAMPATAPADAGARAHAAPPVNVDVTLDIPYAGGVDRDRLENVHRRQRDPDLVVFHHTAMPLTSTFDDVVRVIKGRKSKYVDKAGKEHWVNWITGYNCVITHDGVVHPFCRWDRYGNHAAGFNARSLGITLNGNFETGAKIPYSNHDGRYGPAQPTELQVDAAARVVALWTFVYPDIQAAFPRKDDAVLGAQGIIPHKHVSKEGKTCPGGSFPYAQFEKLIKHYREVWSAAPAARERIETFKRRPYLYTNPKAQPPHTVWEPVPARLANLPAPAWAVTRVGG